jgi:general secretion pathway protein G
METGAVRGAVVPASRGRGAWRKAFTGFTVVELLMSIVIVGVLAAIALPAYGRYQEKLKVRQAVQDIAWMSTTIQATWEDERSYPASLPASLASKLDPWGNPYQYLNLQTKGSTGHARKDHSLVPINSDFDLYSMGPDGKSVSPLTAKASRDDIVRANDGKYIGPASEY